MPTTTSQIATPEESKLIAIMADGLPALVSLLRSMSTDFHARPKQGSPAALASSDADIRLPFDFASLNLMAADDHLDALATLFIPKNDGRNTLTRTMPRFALYPLVRAASEAALRAGWLLEPGLTDTERLQRALVDWLYSAQEQMKMGHDHPTASQRIEALRAKAHQYGFPEIPSQLKDGSKPAGHQISHFGVARLPSTDLASHMATGGENYYRFLCAPTHSTLHALVENSQSIVVAPGNATLAGITLNVRHLFLTLQFTTRFLTVAMEFWASLAGYPDGVWRKGALATGLYPGPLPT